MAASINDKLNYIIQALSGLTDGAVTIGNLEDYVIGDADESAFIGLYVSPDSITKKVSLQELIEHLSTEAVGEHTHSIDDVNGLNSILVPVFIDPADNKWRIDRNSNDFDYTRLINNDKIYCKLANRYIEGIVLDDTIILPAGVDTVKFLITNEKIIL